MLLPTIHRHVVQAPVWLSYRKITKMSCDRPLSNPGFTLPALSTTNWKAKSGNEQTDRQWMQWRSWLILQVTWHFFFFALIGCIWSSFHTVHPDFFGVCFALRDPDHTLDTNSKGCSPAVCFLIHNDLFNFIVHFACPLKLLHLLWFSLVVLIPSLPQPCS